MNLYFSFWMLGQPDNWGDKPGEDCGQAVGYSSGHWNDDNCNNERKYICKHINRKCWSRAHRPMPAHVAVIKVFSAANPGPQCDLTGGWSQFGSKCYKLKADTRKSWSEARHDCVKEGGHLVSVLSPQEEQYHRNSGPFLF